MKLSEQIKSALRRRKDVCVAELSGLLNNNVGTSQFTKGERLSIWNVAVLNHASVAIPFLKNVTLEKDELEYVFKEIFDRLQKGYSVVKFFDGFIRNFWKDLSKIDGDEFGRVIVYAANDLTERYHEVFTKNDSCVYEHVPKHQLLKAVLCMARKDSKYYPEFMESVDSVLEKSGTSIAEEIRFERPDVTSLEKSHQFYYADGVIYMYENNELKHSWDVSHRERFLERIEANRRATENKRKHSELPAEDHEPNAADTCQESKKRRIDIKDLLCDKDEDVSPSTILTSVYGQGANCIVTTIFTQRSL